MLEYILHNASKDIIHKYSEYFHSKGKHRLDVEYGQTYTRDIITKLAEPNSSIAITLFKLYLRVGYKNS